VLAIKSDGTLWFWGKNSYGLDGSGVDNGTIYQPTQIGTDTNWKAVAFATFNASDFAVYGLKTDGTLWFWGANHYGLNGSGTSDGVIYAPTQVGAASDWASVWTRDQLIELTYAAYGIKTDGTLWFWGRNLIGNSGSGTFDALIHTPTQISSDSWACVIGYQDAEAWLVIGLKTNGTLWYWGKRIQPFQPNIYETPTQIGSASNWVSAVNGYYVDGYLLTAGVICLKSDGTLWYLRAWGRGYGQPAFVPTQIGTATNWMKVVVVQEAILGLRADGTLWFLGRNNEGLDGSGVADGSMKVQTQIGTDTDWVDVVVSDVAIYEYHQAFGRKTDGTWWFWGSNIDGHDGSGTWDNLYYAPKLVGPATNWTQVAPTRGYALAITL
jgi:alpha-tubulin suppressor-like RCC1 family protein